MVAIHSQSAHPLGFTNQNLCGFRVVAAIFNRAIHQPLDRFPNHRQGREKPFLRLDA